MYETEVNNNRENYKTKSDHVQSPVEQITTKPVGSNATSGDFSHQYLAWNHEDTQHLRILKDEKQHVNKTLLKLDQHIYSW